MKKMAAVVASLMVTGTMLNAGSLVKSKTIDISFDNFCDGLHMVINQSSGLVTGSYIGCSDHPILGAVGGLSKIGVGTANGYMIGDILRNIVVDDKPRTWTIYNVDGTVFNSGTYSVGVPTLEQSVSLKSVNDW